MVIFRDSLYVFPFSITLGHLAVPCSSGCGGRILLPQKTIDDLEEIFRVV